MRFVIFGKQALTRESLRVLLESERGFGSHVYEGDSPRSCLDAVRDSEAQVLIIDDVNLESKELTFFRGAGTSGEFGIILLSSGGDIEVPDTDLLDGIDRVVLKTSSSSVLFTAVREVGEKFIRKAVHKGSATKRIVGNTELTKREYEVASLVSKGHSNPEIAATLELRVQSVKNLVSAIMRKLKCENRVQIALRFVGTKPIEKQPPLDA